MEYVGWVLSALMGLTVGLIGGGGSIMTVPLLVYFFHIQPSLATISSLLVVGSTSLIGTMIAARKGHLRLRQSLTFAIPSLIGVVFSRVWLAPQVPVTLIKVNGIILTKNIFLMVSFAILMIAAATKMIRSGDSPRKQDQMKDGLKDRFKDIVWSRFRIPIQGLLVGMTTGFLGAGGGFLIVPALVFLIHLPMREAVATSLLIVTINSLVGFASDIIARVLRDGLDPALISFPWNLLLTVTLLAIFGLLMGARVVPSFSDRMLKRIFGWLVIGIGSSILIDQIVKL